MLDSSNQETGLFDELSGFFVGCNYWASHAGTAMWSDWRPEVVEADFRRLAAEGLQVLRVFPLWPDFQPISRLYGGGGDPVEYRFGEELPPDDEAGRAGVSITAIEHFRVLAALAEQYHLKLIVGLVTGWMSGRLFAPPALQGRDILTDHTAILWQVRFVRYFVQSCRDSRAIIAWDLGNECNCMQHLQDRDDAWHWTASLAHAIKAADPVRPLVSGMHSLRPRGVWRMQDQAELLDILTTHPYPYWVPYCDHDPVNTIRPLLHATAESLFYAGIGGKPCFAEEIGTMGPMVCTEEQAAGFIRTSLLSLWAHGCHGLLWWCAYDQTQLDQAPYDWCACEGELGLIDSRGRAKPALTELARLRGLIGRLPFDRLPPRLTEAVCILNSTQDHWAAALGAFILAKQAGFDLAYRFEDQPLPEVPLYLVPSVCGCKGIPKHRWQAILQRVAAGAALYVSVDDGYLLEFEQLTGLRVTGRSKRAQAAAVRLADYPDDPPLAISGTTHLRLAAATATVLGTDGAGDVAFSRQDYGLGQVYFLALPVETSLVAQIESLGTTAAAPYWRIYRQLLAAIPTGRALVKNHPLLGVTEHPLPDSAGQRRVAVLLNYSPERLETPVELAAGWRIGQVYEGPAPLAEATDLVCRLESHEALIIELVRC